MNAKFRLKRAVSLGKISCQDLQMTQEAFPCAKKDLALAKARFKGDLSSELSRDFGSVQGDHRGWVDLSLDRG